MVLIGVVVLEVVGAVMGLVPGFDDDCWISFAVKVLEAFESWCHLGVNDPMKI